jgi:predicted nucleic acid-binding protein
MYRAPSGEVNEFLRGLDATLKHLYNLKSEFIICGDINYINQNNQKQLFTEDIQFVTPCEFCNKNSKYLKYGH